MRILEIQFTLLYLNNFFSKDLDNATKLLEMENLFESACPLLFSLPFSLSPSLPLRGIRLLIKAESIGKMSTDSAHCTLPLPTLSTVATLAAPR